MGTKGAGGDPEWSLAEERLPLDCAYEEFRGRDCGEMRERYLMLDQLSEWISPNVVRRTYEYAELYKPNTAGFVLEDPGADGLRLALAESGNDLRDVFVRHVLAAVDPTLSAIDRSGVYSFGGAPGERHKVINDGRVKWVDPDPAGLLSSTKRSTFEPRTAPMLLTGRKLDGKRRQRKLNGSGGSYKLTIPFSQKEAFAGQPLVLINDSLDDEAAKFSWTAKIIRKR